VPSRRNRPEGRKREKVSFLARRRPSPIAGAAFRRPDSSRPDQCQRSQETPNTRTGDSMNSFSYLPMGLSALFVLAASLLIGLA
jgi:hypothetical protein